MKAAIIGSGGVAAALSSALLKSDDVRLCQIFARNSESGRRIADEAGVPYSGKPEELAHADIYIIAVTDRAVVELSESLPFAEGAVVAHTAGGLGLDALSDKIAHKAVLYPLQTFSRGRTINMREVPVFVEYSDERARECVERAAKALSDYTASATAGERIRMHTAAVFACNFTNYLYCAAENILHRGGMEFDILKPLIRETAKKATVQSSPCSVQTGPAIRGDVETMRRHIDLLIKDAAADADSEMKKESERYKKIYELLSEAIWETLRKI